MRFHTSFVLAAFLGAASILTGVPPVETGTVHNDKVAAGDVTLKPAAVKVARGNAVFQAGQARNIKNTGSSEVHFARIEFTGKGRPKSGTFCPTDAWSLPC
jgi:hypothetical protein